MKKYDLSRFRSEHQFSYSVALEEVKDGYKETHWMWYIFPQIKGLGMSYNSRYFAIEDLDEAKLFLSDSYLGGNLVRICEALLSLETNEPVKIFGFIDSMKLKSSMTLFKLASGNDDNVFAKVLDKFFNGQDDEKTIAIIGKNNDRNTYF